MDQTGIDYPVMTIAGKQCVFKMSRAVFYRLSKSGFDLRRLSSEVSSWFPDKQTGSHGHIRFDTMIDLLHAVLAPQLGNPTPEELADMLDEQYTEATAALVVAISKMQPGVSKDLGAPPAQPAVQ